MYIGFFEYLSSFVYKRELLSKMSWECDCVQARAPLLFVTTSMIALWALDTVQCAGQGADECVVQAEKPWPIYHHPLEHASDLRTEVAPGQVQGTVPLVLSGLSLSGGDSWNG